MNIGTDYTGVYYTVLRYILLYWKPIGTAILKRSELLLTSHHHVTKLGVMCIIEVYCCAPHPLE